MVSLGDSIGLQKIETQLCSFYSYKRVDDGALIIIDAGHRGDGASIHKYNSSNEKEWQKVSSDIYSSDGIVCSNGEYVFTGSRNYNIRLLKIGKNGVKKWMREYNSSYKVQAESVIQTIDDGFLSIGEVSIKSRQKRNLVIYKTDKNGETAVDDDFLFLSF